MCASLGSTPVSTAERRQIKRDLKLRHHIPHSLVSLLPQLERIRLKGRLRRFASQYADFEFDEEPEEYRAVAEIITEMMQELSYPNSVISKVNAVMNVERAYSEADGHYRDHFIHPFQVFLLGMAIIDRHYQKFRDWFSPNLPDQPRTSVESTWLLASIFHDHVKPVKALRNLTNVIMRRGDEEMEETNEVPDATELIEFLSSMHQNLTTGSKWTITRTGHKPELSKLLDEYMRKQNHGVMGALNVLDWVRSAGSMTSTDVVAGLAIALHDGDHQNKRVFPNALSKAGVFPVGFENQPLTCMLLLLDSVQEWGRRPHSFEVDTRLVGVDFKDSIVNVRLSFDDPKVIGDKLEEFQAVGECVVESDVKFTMDLRVHPAGLGVRRRNTMR